MAEVAPIVEDGKSRSDVLLFNRWTYDDVQVKYLHKLSDKSCLFSRSCSENMHSTAMDSELVLLTFQFLSPPMCIDENYHSKSLIHKTRKQRLCSH